MQLHKHLNTYNPCKEFTLMKLSNVGLGMEAIKVQRKEVLFKGLTGKINELRKSKVTLSTLSKSGIADLIQKTTHIDASIQLTSIDWNAHVGVPKLNKNHPLMGKFKSPNFGDEDALSIMYKGKGIFNGWVDLEEGKVHGDFRKVPVVITVAENMFLSKRMSNEEIAAIIMHEIGHVFSYFEQMIQTVTMNYAINAAVGAMFHPARKLPKIKIVDEYAKLRGIDFEEKEKMLALENNEAVATVMLQAEIQKSVSETGASMYDATGFEFLSDQFSTRHGGGIHLVTGLDKIQRFQKDPVYRNPAQFYSLEMIKAVSFFGLIYLGGPATWLAAMLIVAINPHDSTYDLPKDRADRIKRDLIEQLKNNKLDKATKEALVDDLAAIEMVTKAMVQRTGSLQLVWKVLSPTTRRQLKQKEAQQQIEQLLANDFFAVAAKFSNLGA
jgi:hypothetical protein